MASHAIPGKPELDRIAGGLTATELRALGRGRATGEDFALAQVEPKLVKSCLCCLTPLGLAVRDRLYERRQK